MTGMRIPSMILALCLVVGCTYRIPPPPSIGGSRDGAPPLAVKTPEKGVVLSPYKPYSMLDVSNIRAGTVVLDPATGLPLTVP